MLVKPRGLFLKRLVPLAVLLAAAAAICLRLVFPGQAGTVVVEVACDECGYRGPAEVPVATPDQAATCPQCDKRSAFGPVPCPHCLRSVAWNPKAPPTHCPHCQAPLDPETAQP